uniref:Uncharacterized protein n=2 Tax=Cacopsylla melanoneura TaxID=428564 RepID=A0A8D8RPU2_9HEMI
MTSLFMTNEHVLRWETMLLYVGSRYHTRNDSDFHSKSFCLLIIFFCSRIPLMYYIRYFTLIFTVKKGHLEHHFMSIFQNKWNRGSFYSYVLFYYYSYFFNFFFYIIGIGVNGPIQPLYFFYR